MRECICVMKQLSAGVVGMELRSTVSWGWMSQDELHTMGALIGEYGGKSRVAVGSATDPS